MSTSRRLVVLALLSASVAAGLAAACSSDPAASEPGPDASPDVPVRDAARDAPEPAVPAREGGACTAVQGPCDIVLQDCPRDAKGQQQECVVRSTGGGGLATRCIPVQSSQALPAGRACCAGEGNPCLPGLTCVGDPCVDGGPATGRCSPACCEGDDQACGRSDPEGIAGACDIALFVGGAEVHRVCSYRRRCKPFRQEACEPGSACIIEDPSGTAGCVNSFDKQAGEECRFGNDCADGLTCSTLGTDGGAGRCRWQCLTPNAFHPFDASIEEGGPGTGGCPPKERCNIGPFLARPAWLSLCTLDGG
jgi:hypothetical protein